MRIDNNLAEKFDLETVEIKTDIAVIPPALPAVVEDTTKTDIENDVAKSRETIRNLIDKTVSSLDNLLHLALESESARAYEVAAQMIKTASELSKDLLIIQKTKAELTPADDTPNPKGKTNIQNQQNIFVGSTDELIRAMKEIKHEEQLDGMKVVKVS